MVEVSMIKGKFQILNLKSIMPKMNGSMKRTPKP